jgi:nucleotide-binding universal stress UspA family protein
MRRILVPLDGTSLSASILPDAKRLAGPGGTLLLVRDASAPVLHSERGWDRAFIAITAAEEYLERTAVALRQEGYEVQPEVFYQGTANAAIEEAIRFFDPDLVTCATHARSGVGRIMIKSVAWHTLGHASVPVLLHHVDGAAAAPVSGPRRILVPLDGSAYAEKALPLAVELAEEWNARLVLARVAPDLPASCMTPDSLHGIAGAQIDERAEANAYLTFIGQELARSAQVETLSGVVVPTLTRAATRWSITDVVMTSHGRTGLSRILLGSVADGLLHTLALPIIIVPARADPHAEGRPAREHVPVEV